MDFFISALVYAMKYPIRAFVGQYEPIWTNEITSLSQAENAFLYLIDNWAFQVETFNLTFEKTHLKKKTHFNINVANCIVEFDLPVSISKHMLDPFLTPLISKTFLAENTQCSFGVASKRISENSKMQ